MFCYCFYPLLYDYQFIVLMPHVLLYKCVDIILCYSIILLFHLLTLCSLPVFIFISNYLIINCTTFFNGVNSWECKKGK